LSDNRDSELDHAREVWQKKFGNPPINAAEKLKHKQIRFIQSRGFTPEVIRRAIAPGMTIKKCAL
jgi:regulatory protein